MPIQWDQWTAQTLPVIVAMSGAAWKLYRVKNRDAANLAKLVAKQHQENQDKLDAILLDQLYLVPHDHIESRIPGDENIPLTRGGIIRRPPNGGQFKRGGTP